MVKELSFKSNLGITLRHIDLGLTTQGKSLQIGFNEGNLPVLSHINIFFFGDGINEISYGDFSEVLYGT